MFKLYGKANKTKL